MIKKTIIKKTTIKKIVNRDTFHLTKRGDKYWLWDNTRKMNLSMGAESEREAFIEALLYYQKRLSNAEIAHNELKNKVEVFIQQFAPNDEAWI